MATRIPWHFRDYTISPMEEYVWEVNPKEFNTGFKKQITYQTTAAPDGRVLAYEGRDEVQRISFSGTILRQDQYTQMMYWFNKRHQIQIQDDLGRNFSIYITSFEPKRERNNTFPWKHSYNCEAIILDWSDTTSSGYGYEDFPGQTTSFGVYPRGHVGDDPAVFTELSTVSVGQTVWSAVDITAFFGATNGTVEIINFPQNFVPTNWLVCPSPVTLPQASQSWSGGPILSSNGDIINLGTPTSINNIYKYWILWQGKFTSVGLAEFEFQFNATGSADPVDIAFSVNVTS